MKTKDKRKIGGEWYYRQAQTHSTKVEAEKHANRARLSNLKARIIKVAGGYSVYARNN